MKLYAWIFILTFSTLACGVQTSLPEIVSNTQTATEMSTAVNSTATPELSRIVGSWNVREAPGETSALVATLTDASVQVVGCGPYEGGEWCFVKFDNGEGWINRRGLK